MFEKKVSNKIKGITAVAVILFHLTFYITDMPIYQWIFGDIGYLCVGIFFFISGYGTTLKLNEQIDYYRSFIKNKLPKLVIPYLEIFAVYWIAFKLMKTPNMGMKRVLLSLINGHSIVEFSWYVYAVIFFDLCLCLIWVRAKRGKIGFACLLLILYCFAVYMLGWGDHWIRSSGTYLFGIACATYPGLIDCILKHQKSMAFVCAFKLGIGRMPVSYAWGGVF